MFKKDKEGFIKVTGGRIWYQLSGKKDGIPLIILHGGPGYPHFALEPLKALGKDRQIVFYDQLGCGKSDRPSDQKLWTIERFVKELDTLIDFFGFGNVNLLGHSWGGTLAAQYIFTHPEKVNSAILASPFLSAKKWTEEAERLKKKLPKDIQIAIHVHEKAGTFGSPEYKQATEEYYKQFVCRTFPWPKGMKKSQDESGVEVYLTMWGPTEFCCTGTLKNYDATKKLKQIKIPVLYTVGRFDEAGPEVIKNFSKITPNSKVVVFKKSAHQTYIEEEERYIKVVQEFLEGNG